MSISIIVAKYPGTASDGTRVRKGHPIAWNRSTRTVVTADPAKIAEIKAANDRPSDFIDIDTIWEDDCARRCGL